MANEPYTNSFSHILGGSNQFTRRWGANSGDAGVDPLITGYHFIHFAYFPDFTSLLPTNISMNIGQIKYALHSVCSAVTLPGATVNKAEFTGLGGVKFFYPTNVDWDNTVTLRFTEMSGAPIHNIIHAWVKQIGDYRSGINMSATKTAKANFTASMYYWTTRPDGESVEFASLITGMFPTKDPTDQFGFDVNTYDKLELDIDFSCDVVWQESWVYDQCQTLAQQRKTGALGFVQKTYATQDSEDGGTGAGSQSNG